ncbi:phage repressor protein CI [Avibacterium paragallinarum]|nr:phage repressor protein CI [Avibacterium paragallinarum]MEE3608232.1 phage repressor protein CI [Avibacterium paragallinarum]MEE3621697.1 phage repressor protein CI [Avibacterium paragallinarum]MEE3668381.1 phage repressor protein CI [Avibacterium paragallinarum]MEE3680391.1 phage repressor protein CI [Avibacterium paragallinarum]MEE4385950.1 phage repressor protein CI [Avibacterium paragallinarum]
MMPKKELIGGKEVISRIMVAYGFANRKLLAEHLGMPHSTFGTWAKRGFFPAELVIRCVKETGARLDFVAYGEEPIFDEISDLKYFHTIKLENGKSFIYNATPLFINQLPNLDSREAYDNVFAIVENNLTYFATKEVGNLTDGEYFVIVENSHLIRYITVLPAGKIRVDGGKFSFECDLNDIEIVGKVILKMEKM